MLFPFSDFWWFYLGFILFVFVLLGLDLGLFHKSDKELSFKEALLWTCLWMGLAFIFNILFYFYIQHLFVTDDKFISRSGFNPALQAKDTALEFLTGFVVEKSLAVDNIFIFALVFSYFGIPKNYQYRVLFWGILGALFFRAIFIALGSVLMRYEWVIFLFGAFLIITGIKMFFAGNKKADLNQNWFVRNFKKIFRIYPQMEGGKFIVTKDGLLCVTPLFLALVFIELSDIIFALDSVPAIFAITQEPLIVFTSNIFAILGLRSMYFMLVGVMDRFIYIKYGLAAVLVFVGLKMVYLNKVFNGKFPIGWSLAIISTLIASSILVSILTQRASSKH